MKVTQFAKLFAIAALAIGGFAAHASAAIIFSDDFESGSMSNWTQTTATAGSSFVISNAQNASPVGGTNSAAGDTSADRMHRNIIGDNAGSEVSGHSKFTSWVYDDGNNGTTGASRAYNEIRSYSATGLPNGSITADGTLSQLIAIGKMNQPTGFGSAYSATKYQGRITSGPAGQIGYFNLDGVGAPSRSVGWKKFTIERLPDNTTLNFYINDILSKTITGYTLPSWDTIVMGPGSGAQAGAFYIDGISVETIPTVPEPTTLALVGVGMISLVAAGRRKNA